MSGVQFVQGSDSRPSAADLASFASRAKDIQIGSDDIVDLGDDLGLNLLTNQNKVAPSPRGGSGSNGGNGGNGGNARINLGSDFNSNNDIPSIQIRPVDDLDVVNLDAAPGASDIRITHDSSTFGGSGGSNGSGSGSEPAPFVINVGGTDVTPNSGSLSVSPEEELRQKKALLTKLQRLDGNGIGGQKMTLSHSLEDIKSEYEKRTDSRNLEASIRFQRNALMTFVTGVEMVNEKFGDRLPVKPRLKGWSESVHTNVEDFDEIFEELYDMYKDSAKMHPMLRLVGTLGVSATMYHLTNTAAERSGIPGMSDVLNENPELQRQFAAAMMAKMGGGLGNFMAAASGNAAPMPPQQAPMHPGLSSQIPMFNVSSAASQSMPQQQQQSTPVARREMRGPSGVDDILRAFEAERAATSVPIMPATAGVFAPAGSGPGAPSGHSVTRAGVGSSSDILAEFMDDTHSVESGNTMSTMNTERRRGRKRPAPVGATLNLNV
jgi:hypothetical protein